MADPDFFGIRHHGPGCARSLVAAFNSLRPDCVLVEGPPESNDLLQSVLADGMQPPVALLGYCPDEPGLAIYHPFAEFSPEWQAVRWAVLHGVPVRFIDLPLTHSLAMRKVADEQSAADEITAKEGSSEYADEGDIAARDDCAADPLDWLARAAGYADGESWWNHLVEERGDGEELFAAVAEAMTALREDAVVSSRRDEGATRRELLREAHMRQCVRETIGQGAERIAVVCGAWHLAALRAPGTAKADQALLKGLPKVKISTTWIPWTYRHLTSASGYGAGIDSPGWYEHLWHSRTHPELRTVGWLSRVARLMRERDLDCSSAHLIEAARLADSLAAMRDRPSAGLEELQEAIRTVLTMGDESVSRFIADELLVGDRLGSVPADLPLVPLQRELEQTCKSLRLKQEATQRTIDLDLRTSNDLSRSHLLHRLRLLELPWGQIARVGRSKGTFHEVWQLQWQPDFVLRLIEAGRWGQTIAQAATAIVVDRAGRGSDLGELSVLLDTVLLAGLGDAAVKAVTTALQTGAAVTGDVMQLLSALPPLANVFRYGNVRKTDAFLVSHVLDGLIVRAAISLPLACGVDDAAAGALRDKLLAAHDAVALRQGEQETAAWHAALQQIAAMATAHRLLQGAAARLLLDAGVWSGEQASRAISFHLSAGADPGDAAAWLEGFLNGNALVLLHDNRLWELIDTWLAALSEEHFNRVLPLVRRTFSTFSPGERRELAQRAANSNRAALTAETSVQWDEERAVLPIPLLYNLLGVHR